MFFLLWGLAQKLEPVPQHRVSVSWSIVPYTNRFQVRLPVGGHIHKLLVQSPVLDRLGMFLSLSIPL